MTKKNQPIWQKQNSSVSFRYVPENIGEIEFSETTNPNDKPIGKSERVLTVIALVALAVFAGYMFYQGWEHSVIRNGHRRMSGMHSFLGVAAIGLGIYIYIKKLTFSGIDYFTGTEGFCLVGFDKRRENMKVVTVLYEDIADIIEYQRDEEGKGSYYSSSEPLIKPYRYTHCEFKVIGKSGLSDVLARGYGAYYNPDKRKIRIKKNPTGNLTLDQTMGLAFWRRICGMMSETWYGEAKVQLSRGESVQFDRYEKERIVKGDIEVSRDFLRIGDRKIVWKMVENVDYRNGLKGNNDMIIIKYLDNNSETHSQFMIDLQRVSRRDVFVRLFKETHGSDCY